MRVDVLPVDLQHVAGPELDAAFSPGLLELHTLVDGEVHRHTEVYIAPQRTGHEAIRIRHESDLDIVDLGTSTAIPDDLPWLTGIAPDWRVRLRALLWGVRECLMKSGQVDARNVWGLDGVDALPVESAGEVIARWPAEAVLEPLQIQVDDGTVDGAFAALGSSTLLVMTSMPSPQPSNGMPIQ